MRQSIRLGRVAGIPFGVHWSVIVIVGLITAILGNQVLPAMAPGHGAVLYWAVAVAGALLFVVALLAHELAHAFVATRAGVPVRSITLWALGGVAELGSDSPNARADLKIAIAGPATSLAAGLVFGGLAVLAGTLGGPVIVVAGLLWLATMNGLLAVFNLLPGAPLDGGRVLRALLWMRHGDRSRAARTAANAGRIVGGLLVAAGLAEFIAWQEAGGLWLMLIGIFMISAASAEAAAQLASDALGGLRVQDVMTPQPDTGAGWATVADFTSRVAMHSTQTVFPVVGFDGALAGVVSLTMLARLPEQARAQTPLRDIAAPVPPAYVAAPGDPAAPLMTRPPLVRELAAVVTDDGRIVGLVTTNDLSLVVRRAQLRGREAPRGAPV